MRGGAQLRCVVNGAAGRSADFEAVDAADRRADRGDRRRSGGPDLRVAGGGQRTRSRSSSATVAAGGAFRYAGKAPLFQEVVANQDSFDRYVAQLVAACTARAWRFATASTSRARRTLLAPFDRIVIATGARYRFGLGRIAVRAARSRRRPLAGSAAHVRHAGIPRLVLRQRPHGRPAKPPASRAARPEGDRDRRCRSRGQEHAGDPSAFEAALLAR